MTTVRISSCVPRAWGRLVAVALQEQRLSIDGVRMRAGASLAQTKAFWGPTRTCYRARTRHLLWAEAILYAVAVPAATLLAIAFRVW